MCVYAALLSQRQLIQCTLISLTGERVAVIINNLGGTSYLELNVVAKEMLQLCG